jgi:hypothetical protein
METNPKMKKIKHFEEEKNLSSDPFYCNIM